MGMMTSFEGRHVSRKGFQVMSNGTLVVKIVIESEKKQTSKNIFVFVIGMAYRNVGYSASKLLTFWFAYSP
ncbi:hypothetical protein YC2023_005492 [Brassica napus]